VRRNEPFQLDAIPAERVAEFETWIHVSSGRDGAQRLLRALAAKRWGYSVSGSPIHDGFYLCRLGVPQVAAVRARATEIVDAHDGLVADGVAWRVEDGQLKASLPTAPARPG
jgi:hypothetical protein